MEKTRNDLENTLKMLLEDNSTISSSKFKKGKAIFSVPRFEIEFETILNGNLQELGMNKAFSQEADFRHLVDADVFVSAVIHKTFIKFEEEGTKAAAVTVVVMKTRSIRREPEPFVMKLDRPFLLFLRHKKSSVRLFSALIQNI